MYKFRIDSLMVNTNSGVKTIAPKKINVLVGPNNSGKSRLLRELRDFLSGDIDDLKIIDHIEYPAPKNYDELNESYYVDKKIVRDQFGNWMLKAYSNKPNQILDMTSSLESYYTKNLQSISGDWREFINNLIENMIRNKQDQQFFHWCGSMFYQYMGTEERLTICKTQKDYGIDSNNINFLSAFQYKIEILDELAKKVKLLFDKDIYLDAQTLGDRLAFRVGKDFDYFREKNRSDEKDAMTLYSEPLLDVQGDGLKSFISTFLSLKLEDNNILLVDEPEAFLHPPLARQLGEMIGEYQKNDKCVFVATHSVEILKGILSKNHDVNVIRITRAHDNQNEINILDQSLLADFLQDPLLRVSRILEGVFCEKVIITEAEADELVYQELIEKIHPESGLYFAHGQNKQTLAHIAEFYQKIGINYEIIVDFDIFRVSSELSKFLEIMPIQEKDKQHIMNYADKLRKIVNDTTDNRGMSDKDMLHEQKKNRDDVYHRQGIRFFNEDIQRKIKHTLEQLSTYHLHILETGELETLLENFGVSYSEKKIWIAEAINKIANLTKEDFLREKKLYSFIKRIV